MDFIENLNVLLNCLESNSQGQNFSRIIGYLSARDFSIKLRSHFITLLISRNNPMYNKCDVDEEAQCTRKYINPIYGVAEEDNNESAV